MSDIVYTVEHVTNVSTGASFVRGFIAAPDHESAHDRAAAAGLVPLFQTYRIRPTVPADRLEVANACGPADSRTVPMNTGHDHAPGARRALENAGGLIAADHPQLWTSAALVKNARQYHAWRIGRAS